MRQLNIGNKSVEQKLEEMKKEKEPVVPAIEGEIIQHIDTSPLEVQQVMKKYRLKKATRGVRIDIDEDLHIDFKILCAKTGISQQDYLAQWIEEGLKKEKRKLEK